MGLNRDLGGGGVEAFHDRALIAEDQPGGAGDRLLRPPVDTGLAAVRLPAGGVTQVPVGVGGTGHVGQGIGAGRHSLGAQGLDRPAAGHLGAHHRGDVALQTQVVDHPQACTLPDQTQPAAVGGAVHQDGGAAGLEPGLRPSGPETWQLHRLTCATLLQHRALLADQLPGSVGRQGGGLAGGEQGHPDLQVHRCGRRRLHEGGGLPGWGSGSGLRHGLAALGLELAQLVAGHGGVHGAAGRHLQQGVQQGAVADGVGARQQALGGKTHAQGQPGDRHRQDQLPVLNRSSQAQSAGKPGCKVPSHRR